MPNNNKCKSQQQSSSEMDSYQVRTLQKKRTTNFREDETKLLISLWGSPVIQNKLYLTHRKAPVMRLLAANMQQRGFYRSPDEIKTRIRNLKCLYHRIKRTMVTGTGIGTVDPDWPHFKAMDTILGKENANKADKNKAQIAASTPLAGPGCVTSFKDEKLSDIVQDSPLSLEGPRCEDIKQEIELDINDDMESWTGNDSIGGSDYEDNHISATSIVKATLPLNTIQESNNIVQQIPTHLPRILPNISIPTAGHTTNLSTIRPNGAIPLPLLILNHGIHSQQLPPITAANNKRSDQYGNKGGNSNNESNNDNTGNCTQTPDLTNILREILSVQSQQLELEKQKFELEKQRLEFDRVVGSQLMTLVPMVGGLLQRLVYPTVASAATVQQQQQQSSSSPSHQQQQQQHERRHNSLSPSAHNSIIDATDSAISCDDNEAESKPVSDYDILKDSKILRTVLERGIKKYMMADETRDKDNDDDSENDDSRINEGNNLLIDNDDNSNSNSK